MESLPIILQHDSVELRYDQKYYYAKCNGVESFHITLGAAINNLANVLQSFDQFFDKLCGVYSVEHWTTIFKNYDLVLDDLESWLGRSSRLVKLIDNRYFLLPKGCNRA